MSDELRRLSNPIRLKILDILAERGEMKISELKEILGISTGSLYYHLDVLGDLIEKQRGVVKLSEKGLRIYREFKGLVAEVGTIRDTIFVSKPVLALALLAAILNLYLFYSYCSLKLTLIVLCLYPAQKISPLICYAQPLFLILTVLTLTYIVTRRISREYALAAIYTLASLVPQIPLYLAPGSLHRGFLILSLSAFIIILAVVLSKVVGMKLEKGFVVSLTTVYVALAVSLFL